MAYQQIRDEPGRVARVVLARPEYRNAQPATLLDEVDDALTKAASDDAVRVIVLSGEGDAFSSGHDLGTPEQVAWREEHWGRTTAVLLVGPLRADLPPVARPAEADDPPGARVVHPCS